MASITTRPLLWRLLRPGSRRLPALGATAAAICLSAVLARLRRRHADRRPTADRRGRTLVIVSRERRDLFEELRRAQADGDRVELILDRRRAPGAAARRRAWQGPERRAGVSAGDRWSGAGVKVVIF